MHVNDILPDNYRVTQKFTAQSNFNLASIIIVAIVVIIKLC